MDRNRRSALATGVVLILVGVVFLAGQLIPGGWGWLAPLSWPLIVIGVGVLLLVIGLATGVPSMAVPACIVGGIGALLYWQNATGKWESWAYAWALIPGFVGVGVMVAGLLEGKWQDVRGGAWLVAISLILFAIFASFLGGPAFLGKYWPLLLIVLGLVSLAQFFFQRRR